MDITDLVPLIASHIGIDPATLLLFIAIVHLTAKFGSRIIPNDATGLLAVLRNACAVLGVDPSSRITSGVTVQDVAAQALTTPPITQKVEAATDTKQEN